MIQPADQLTTLGRITALEKLCIAVFPYSAPDGVTHLLRGREGGREGEREREALCHFWWLIPPPPTPRHTQHCIGAFTVLLFPWVSALWWFCLLKIKMFVNKWVLTVNGGACYCGSARLQLRILRSRPHRRSLLHTKTWVKTTFFFFVLNYVYKANIVDGQNQKYVTDNYEYIFNSCQCGLSLGEVIHLPDSCNI